MANAEMPGPRATFAKAVVRRHTATSMIRVAARQATWKRTLAQRRLAEATQDQQVAPSFRLAAWSGFDMSAPRFALSVQTDSQFTYAAVPVRGGWLIVQL